MGERRIGDGTWSVLVIDMFHYDADDEQIVRGFPTFDAAKEYARRRTRDSLEELRKPGITPEELRRMWHSFGEDCLVIGGGYAGLSELDFFIANPATSEERDWQAAERETPR